MGRRRRRRVRRATGEPDRQGYGRRRRGRKRRLLPRHVMIVDDSGVRSFLSWISERVSRVQYNPDTTPVRLQLLYVCVRTLESL